MPRVMFTRAPVDTIRPGVDSVDVERYVRGDANSVVSQSSWSLFLEEELEALSRFIIGSGAHRLFGFDVDAWLGLQIALGNKMLSSLSIVDALLHFQTICKLVGVLPRFQHTNYKRVGRHYTWN